MDGGVKRAQGHFNTQLGGAWDQTSNFTIIVDRTYRYYHLIYADPHEVLLKKIQNESRL